MTEPKLTMDQMGDLFAAHHAAPEPTPDEFMAAYEAARAPAQAVTEEEAAGRHMQEVLWMDGVIRFRENGLVRNLLGTPHRPSEDPIEPWMEEQLKELGAEDGNEIVRWLIANGPADLNAIAMQQFPQKDEEQFAMLIGYSVSAAGDLSYFSPAMIARADAEADRLIAERDAK